MRLSHLGRKVVQICNENVCWLITNPERGLSCSTLRDQTDLCLFVYLLWTTLTFIGLNCGSEANYIITLLEIIVLNQIIASPDCFPHLHLGTRISCQWPAWTLTPQPPIFNIHHYFSAWLILYSSYTLTICRSNFFTKGVTCCIVSRTGIHRSSTPCTDL